MNISKKQNIIFKVVFSLILLGGIVSNTVMAAKVPKIDVCHIPPGNPESIHTIQISENALPAHLAHGDILGSCNAACDELCSDGNACTIDHDGDCEANG